MKILFFVENRDVVIDGFIIRQNPMLEYDVSALRDYLAELNDKKVHSFLYIELNN